MTEILLSDPGDDLLRKLAYTYNEVDNIVQIVETRSGPSTITKTYDYDAIDQLIEETWSTGYSAEYEHDENGNRTRRTVGSTVENYFYGDDDELTEIKIGSTVVKSFGYDGAGRRTSATYSGVTTSYAYDYESRITSITRTGVTANSFAYNGLDTRVSKTDSGGTTTYKRAGAYVTDSLLKSTVSSTTTDYTPGVSSRVSGTSTFDHAGLKNTDEQTDSSGDIAASRQYDAFGNVISYQTWAGTFGYGGAYGYQTDADHGLMLLGHRYYESDTGRFLTRDPIKDGRNWYVYCGGNPIRHVDPSGLLVPFVLLGIAATLVLTTSVAEAPTAPGDFPMLDPSRRERFAFEKLMLAIEIVTVGRGRPIKKLPDAPATRSRWFAGPVDRAHPFPREHSKKIPFDHPAFHETVPIPRDIHRLKNGLHPQGYNRLVKDLIMERGGYEDITPRDVDEIMAILERLGFR